MSDLDAASALAIDGLTFVSQHEVYRDRFLQLSGIEASQIRKAAGEPGFFPGLLDFLLADERTLQAFAEWRAVSPQSVESARRTLTAAYGAGLLLTRRGESCGPSPGSIARSKERLLILDVDEVVLHFIEPFEELLAEYGARLHPESFRLTGNVRSISTSAAISGHEIDGVTARLYDEQEVRQRPVEGVADALSRLAQHADIVFLTAMTPAFFDRRRRLLDREGLHYPMIATTRSKGSLVAELVEGWKGPAVFVDDLPPNLSGVRKSVPEIHLLHLMANDVFRPHLPPLPAGTHRARDWREAEPLLVELLLGAISAPACPAAPADA